MKIIRAFPPNFREINARFNVRGKPVIFCYGDRIYNPAGAVVGPDLVAHETVHSERQQAYAGGVAAWWQRYIEDHAFRGDEEIPAHRAELAYWRGRADSLQAVKGFRRALDRHELQIAQRLSSPLYGGLMSLSDARAAIQ